MKRVLAVTGLVGLVFSALGVTSALGEGRPERRPRPGDLIRDVGVGAVVPRAGLQVHVESIMADGSIQEFGISTDEDGNVTLHAEGEEKSGEQLSEGGSSDLGSPGPCSDNAYSLNGWKWNSTFTWSYKLDSTPTGLDQANTRSQIRAATTNITNAYNDCGRADNVDATQSYAGDTTRNTGIDNAGNCTSWDGYNVVTFGDLSSANPIPLAVACTTSTVGGIAIESDVKYNKNSYNWSLNPGSSCSGKFDVQSVGTHERGHTFGLGHVGEANHAYLTMSKKIKSCTTGARTLGLGDMLGLEILY